MSTLYWTCHRELTGGYDQNGFGSIVPVASLADTFDSDLALLWADNTNGSGAISPSDIMSRVTRGFSTKQLGSFRKVSTDDIATICRENFSGSSACFASVIFDAIPGAGSNQTLNYTIRADSALGFVNVADHTSDYEVRILPLQWAVESVSVARRWTIDRTSHVVSGYHRARYRSNPNNPSGVAVYPVYKR